MSKIEAGRHSLHDEEIEIADAIADALLVLDAAARKKRISLLQHIDPKADYLWADHKAIRQILINLISNAVKFTPEDGRVTVSALCDDEGQLLFEVSDTGIGIPPEALDRIFQPFEQVDTTLSRQFEGTGLGLSITRGLVELHGGRIEVTSEVGKGTTLRVSLPPERLLRNFLSGPERAGTIR
jgi:signal transduction histidine kinase